MKTRDSFNSAPFVHFLWHCLLHSSVLNLFIERNRSRVLSGPIYAYAVRTMDTFYCLYCVNFAAIESQMKNRNEK